MYSNVTIKNVSWPHFSWPTLYIPLTGVNLLSGNYTVSTGMISY